MMDVITGKTRPDAGQAFFGSTIDLLRLRENEIASVGIGRKFQKPTVFEHLIVFENLELALKADRGVRASMFFRLTGEQLDRIGEMLTLIHLKDSAQRTAGLLSHGQKQWLEIGMLLMQDPKLLLLDEPVAGMTDEETERTAELFLSLEGSHSLVVVEHDMKFIHALTARQPGEEGDGAARGQRARRRLARRGAGQREGGRGLPWPLSSRDAPRRRSPPTAVSGPLLEVDGVNQYYGGSHILRNVGFEAQVGEVTVVLGRNGVGKTTLLKSLMGVVPVTHRQRRARRRRHHARHAVRAGAQRHRLRAAGPRDLRPPDGAGEPARWAWPTSPAATPLPPELFELFPVLKQMLQPPRRRPVRRPAAAARDRARARRRAAAADPRRADRGHPAEHHQGHRPRHPHARRPGCRRRQPRRMAIVLVEQYYDFAEELADQYLVMERGEIVQHGPRRRHGRRRRAGADVDLAGADVAGREPRRALRLRLGRLHQRQHGAIHRRRRALRRRRARPRGPGAGRSR